MADQVVVEDGRGRRFIVEKADAEKQGKVIGPYVPASRRPVAETPAESAATDVATVQSLQARVKELEKAASKNEASLQTKDARIAELEPLEAENAALKARISDLEKAPPVKPEEPKKD